MTTPNNPNDQNNSGGVRRANPDQAAVDPDAAAQQEQVKADHDALEQSARRVESSVPAGVRDTPVQGSAATARNDAGTTGTGSGSDLRITNTPQTSVDRNNAALQEKVRSDHDALEESAQRVRDSVPAAVRDTPVQPSRNNSQSGEDNTRASRDADAAHENAETARESARRVEQSLPDGQDRD